MPVLTDVDEDVRLPDKHDRLFSESSCDWNYNACVNVRENDTLAYTEGYLFAARCLVKEVVTTQSHQDFLIYPIIFLYRHHIELQLKQILKRSFFIMNRSPTDNEKQHLSQHRLDKLWHDASSIYADVCVKVGWDAPASETLEGVESYIAQLSALDSDSFCFRYAASKKGIPSLPSDLKRINIVNFSETIERLVSYLDGTDVGLYFLQSDAEM